jgi:NADPH:quinone reductase-like Zn-dependent oxidoreductase
MKAIVHDTYGSPDVLQLREIDTPVVGDDEVLVRVRAAGVDQSVWHFMAGLPYLVRRRGRRAPRSQKPSPRLGRGRTRRGGRRERDPVPAW